MSSLALLEEMSSYANEMVDAARANDWDRLTRLEKKVASLRDRMGMEEALGFQGRASRRMSEEERLKKVALIRRILDDDKEVRVHTEPWMDSVRQLLSGGSRQRKLRDAYGGNESDV